MKDRVHCPLLHDRVKARQKEQDYYEKHPEKTKPIKALHEFAVALEYCEWIEDPNQRLDVQTCYPYCCWNHQVGMPTIKYEDKDGNLTGESEPIEFYEYEKDMVYGYESTHYYGVNKCRGAGESEIITVRHLAFKYIINVVKNRKALIIAGLNKEAAHELMHRIKDVCDKIPFVYKYPPRSDYPDAIFFRGGGIIISLAASLNVLRLFENVGDLIYEESAFWKHVNDIPVLLAGEPHVAKSSAHIGSLSTPNGQRGFMWTKIFNPEVVTKYKRHVLNWREVCGLPEKNIEKIATYDMVTQKLTTQFDVFDRAIVDDYYKRKYDNDPEYKLWFDKFFGGKSIDRILSIKIPVLNPRDVMVTYFTDKAEYDQEYDNQFVLSESRAYGTFQEADFEPVEFDEIFQKARQ